MTGVRVAVVKIGGEVIRGAALPALAAEIAALARAARVVVVHGGGPQTTELQQALGQTPAIVGGRRKTDAQALAAIKMAVGGAASVDLCAALTAAGARPVALTGASSLAIRAVRRPPRVVAGGGPEPVDLGFVGDVVGFAEDLLELLLGAGLLPVLASLGCDEQGQLYNINADVVATRLAAALGATDLLAVTAMPGVLRDLSDPDSRIPRLRASEARALIEDGTVSGGMIPKLEESLAAIRGGVRRVHLLDGDLARAIAEPGSVGTLVESDQ